MRYLITGGAGFMGSNFTRYILRKYSDATVLVYDKLTYAGRLENLHDMKDDPRFKFIKADICDEEQLLKAVKEFQPDAIINLAGETHVDRSINEPAPFLKTNVLGVFNILETARKLETPLVVHVSSVTGDTPVLLRDRTSGKIFLARIDFLNIENFHRYEALTIDENYNATFKPITNVIIHEADEIYEVKYEGGGKIKVTGSHSVFVWDKEGIKVKYVSELKVGDKLVTLHTFKRNAFERKWTLKIDEYLDVNENNGRLKRSIKVRKRLLEYLANKDSKSAPKSEVKKQVKIYYSTLKDMINQKLIEERNGIIYITEKGLKELSNDLAETKRRILRRFYNIPEDLKEIIVTPELMWLFGLYLAEGHASHTEKELKRRLRKITIVSSDPRVLERAKQVLEKSFRYTKAVIRRRNDGQYSLEFGGKILHKIFSQFGCTAEEKTIPSWVWYLPRKHVEALLEGYAGDAYTKPCGSRVYTSRSQKLITQLLWLCRLKGISSRIYSRLCRNTRGKFQKKPPYDLAMFDLVISSDNVRKGSIRIPHSKCIPVEIIINFLKGAGNYKLLKALRSRLHKPNKVIAKDTILKFVSESSGEIPHEILKILKSDIGVAKVRSIRRIEKKTKVYDIEIKGNNKFFGGNVPILLHNTDEVYGDLWGKEPADEEAPFRPSSPYSASKASGDLLCQSYWRTYRLPVIIVRPSNNYGPYQFPEKFIPKTIIRALHGKPIPIYGKGDQVRDWLYVEDFAEAMDTVINKGSKGEAYNVPGLNERRNLEVVETILKLMGKPKSLIKHVEDRPGHDRRYAMRGDKILALGWRPKTPWVEGLKRTIKWYIENKWWWRPLLSDDYFQLDTPWRKR